MDGSTAFLNSHQGTALSCSAFSQLEHVHLGLGTVFCATSP